MEFYEVVKRAATLLQQQGKLTYRTLRRQFALDDETLEDLKEELLFSHPVVDEDGRGLVWTGETEAAPDQATSTPTDSPTPEAERRQLTVMFCDLVGSTALSGQLDPEDLRDVVRAYQAACTDVIQRFDGHVAQHLGDGLLVYFGYPAAHEDDAQRAVRAGLGILDAMQSLNPRLDSRYGLRLAVRIGIHTGLTVIGDIGAGGRQEQLALGETPNIAARIQDLAAPDTVVMSAATHRLTQGFFDCESIGDHALRGVAEPITVYRVLGDSGAQHRLDVAGIRGLTPLVGREREVDLLLDRWEQAKRGQGQVVLLSGEAGIGKSRLVQVIKDHAAEGPHTRLECRSSPYFTNSALYPITDFLQRALRFQTDDTPEQKLEKLTQNLSQYRLSLDESAPLFGALLSLPVPEGQYPPLHLSPQRQRQKTLEAIVAMMLELAEGQPVLFILEDLHWTDPTTLDLLHLLLEQTPTASVYALLTCRPEFQPDWPHRSYLSELSLNRLSHPQIEQIATQIAGGKTLPAGIIEQLVDKTDGVPLYVEEMTKSVLESGQLKEVDGHYELTSLVSSLSVPATLQDSLMARLDRLVTAKGVAQYAAVIGRQFSYDLLRAVSELDDATLQRELGRLVEAELLYQRGVIPQATYVFKHALIQDTAYASLLRSARQGYHERIAKVVAQDFPETGETQPELLAYHYSEAGLIELAVGYWQQAGEQARSRSAYVEAIAHFNQGLEALATLPETHERMQRELPLQIALALAYHASRGQSAPELVRAYKRARELCEHVSDDYQLFRVLVGLWRSAPPIPEMEEYRQEIIRVAERTQDAHLIVEAHRLQGSHLMTNGEFVRARRHLEQVVALYDPQDHHYYAAHSSIDPGVSGLSRLSWTLWMLGYPDQALARSQETLELARQLGHVHSLAMICNFAALLHQLRRESQMVYEHTQAATALAVEHSLHQWRITAFILAGWRLAHHGQGEVGIAQIQQGLADYAAAGATIYRGWYLALLAEAYGCDGQPAAALDALAQAMMLDDFNNVLWTQS